MGNEVFYIVAAVIGSFLCAFCFVSTFVERKERLRAVRLANGIATGEGKLQGAGLQAAGLQSAALQSTDLQSVNLQGEGFFRSGFDGKIITYAQTLTLMISSGMTKPFAKTSKRAANWFSKHAKTAGIVEDISLQAFLETRLRLGFIGALTGALIGVVFSTEMAFLLALTGGFLGYKALMWAISQQERRRSEELERHLSEMLEVIALGLRSGLSFDRSLQLYTQHFSTLLSHSCALAQKQWSFGLKTREEALRNLAESYNSVLFGRVVENLIRSLRFGSALAQSLESAAAEARCAYRTQKQEQVAKAPVKMMLPTGALMLPAMLILVIGPVLLELAGGF